MIDVNGILLVDKPQGKTSHDIVDDIRWFLGTRKVGHTGTLDPNATGLLVLCIGKALKVIEFLENFDKEYEVTIHLGLTTDSDDAWGNKLKECDVSYLNAESIREALLSFRGDILQKPPIYSAVKIKGVKLYELARRGKEIDLPERKVTIKSISDIKIDLPLVHFRIICSKGTYIRSIARDLGEKLGCGGIVKSLRRIACGHFRVEKAIKLDEANVDVIKSSILTINDALNFMKEIAINDDDANRFCNGLFLPREEETQFVRVINQGKFMGVGEITEGLLKPKKVFN